MARIRTVKPEYWTDRRVGECSTNARLLFIATWNFADDEGGLDRSAKQLKAQAFPYDNLDCEPLIQELLDAGLLIEYQSGGDKYLHIKNFRKHQKIDRPQKARLPVYEPSMSIPRALDEDSSNVRRSKGREGNGKEGIKDPSDAPRPANIPDPEFSKFKMTFPARAGAQPWHRAWASIRARLTEGHTWSQILEGAQRYATFVMATGKLNTEYVMQAATFCGPSKGFLEDWTLPATKADNRLAANISAANEFLARTDPA